MTTPLSLGFIGGGVNSAIGLTHRIACQMDGHFQLVAGCFSRRQEINQQTAHEWGISPERCYVDSMSFIASEKARLDAVVILTPTPTHRDMIFACLRAGLPVICEKALVAESGDARELEQYLRREGGHVFVTFNYTGYPMVRELRQRVVNDELGRIEHIMVEMPQEGFAREREDGSVPLPQQWRQQDGTIPTVSLDLGVHVHHLVHFLTGKRAVDVYAINNTFAKVPGVVDTVNLLARYEDDMVCNYWYGKAALGYRNGLRIRVMGTLGCAEWLQMEPELLRFSDVRGNVRLIDRTALDNSVAQQTRYCRFKAGHPAGFIEAFANYYADIAASLRGETSMYAAECAVALEGLDFFEKVQQSALSAKPVHLCQPR